MAVIPPNTAINRILAALGLENVRSLKISAEVNSAVAVVTEQYVTGTQMDDLATALETKEWVLVPKAAGRWITVSERLPPVGEKVLYTCLLVGDGPEDYFTDVNAGCWDGEARNLPGNPAMKYDDSNDWQPCSHWMPLPEPPEVK